jgi:hypothetical protein
MPLMRSRGDNKTLIAYDCASARRNGGGFLRDAQLTRVAAVCGAHFMAMGAGLRRFYAGDVLVDFAA